MVAQCAAGFFSAQSTANAWCAEVPSALHAAATLGLLQVCAIYPPTMPRACFLMCRWAVAKLHSSDHPAATELVVALEGALVSWEGHLLHVLGCCAHLV